MVASDHCRSFRHSPKLNPGAARDQGSRATARMLAGADTARRLVQNSESALGRRVFGSIR
jgi:hypothetical protein